MWLTPAYAPGGDRPVIPYDSFLLDPPMLFTSERLTARITKRMTPEHRRAARTTLGSGTVAILWATSVSLYLNVGWTRWIWEMWRAESGRDWMLNSDVFHFEHRNPTGGGRRGP
ncbi:MAG TPA: hypothetical protein VID47_16780 [Actinomycetota bacterium]|jgi:hypothetical protein